MATKKNGKSTKRLKNAKRLGKIKPLTVTKPVASNLDSYSFGAS